MNALIDSNILGNPRLAAVCLDALLKSFVVLAFAGGLCLAWRRAAAATRHLIWFLALGSLLCLPFLPYVLPAAHRPLWSVTGGSSALNEISLSLELAPVEPAAAINNPEPVSANNSTQPSARESARRLFNAHVNQNWLGIGFIAWMSGLLLTLLYPVLGQFQLRKISAKARTLESLEWNRLLIEASETLALRRPVTLLQSSDNVMPLTWGWLWPKVLMPAEAEQWPNDRRRVVLLHELAHVKRLDCLTQNIARLVCGIYWFNPLAWIAARQMCIERERACDDLVLNGGCKASDYAGHLVQIAQTFRRVPQAAGIAMARSSNLEQRVTAIVDGSRARHLRPAGLAGVLISILAVMFYIGSYKTSLADQSESNALLQQQIAQLEKFSAEKFKQAQLLAASSGEKISPEYQKLFDAAMSGDWQTVNKMDDSFKQRHPQYSRVKGIPMDIRLSTSYWSTALEVCLAYDHITHCEPKYTQIAVNDMMQSIAPGSIYFGGTDPGRGLPTAFSKSHVNADPFYTITQNALADLTYLGYLRNTYGERRHWLGLLTEARRADSELQSWDAEYQTARETEASLMSQLPEKDTKCEAADKATEDLRKKRTERTDKIFAALQERTDAHKKTELLNVPPQSIYTPTDDESQNSFKEYTEDAGRRLEHDQKFPKEPRQIKPGENVQKDQDGKVQVTGQIAVMDINALLAKIIFDKNPDREFYIEESFPLHWMYPHLEPAGPIMKINRQPLAALPDDVIQKDHAYWQARVNEMIGNWLTDETPVKTVADFAEKVYVQKDLTGFTGDAAFVHDNYAPKMFSKWRSSIGGLYSWRMGVSPYGPPAPSQYAPKSGAERQRMIKEADFALKQAYAICPFSPEAVYRYVNFLIDQKRKSDAVLVVQAAAHIDPEHFNDLLRNVSQYQAAEASPSPSAATTQTSKQLQEMRELLEKKEAEYTQKKSELEKLKAMDREALRKALPEAASDLILSNRLAELKMYEQQLITFRERFGADSSESKHLEAVVADWQNQINARTEGIMIGLQAKLDATASFIATVKAQLEHLQASNQHSP
jgi:beta-lactamase regulating signal transducer with metallopeptidase domain